MGQPVASSFAPGARDSGDGMRCPMLADFPNRYLTGKNVTISEQPADLDNQIMSLVREWWDEHRTPLLLSRLGNQYNGEIARKAKEQEGGLGAYLHRRLSNRVQVIQHSTKSPLIGAVPADVDADAIRDIDVLLDQTRSQVPRTDQRFHPAFWAAFRKPLLESKRRYMSVHTPLQFQDVLSDDRPDGFIEVDRKYVVGTEAEVTEVQQAIQHWLADNGFESTAFLTTRTTATAQLPSDDLLGRLLLALESDDLKRLSMPLDIVDKLRRQSL